MEFEALRLFAQQVDERIYSRAPQFFLPIRLTRKRVPRIKFVRRTLMSSIKY